MLQNDEALHYGKPHLCYITLKTSVLSGVVSINFEVIPAFLLGLQISIRGCTPMPNCPWHYPN